MQTYKTEASKHLAKLVATSLNTVFSLHANDIRAGLTIWRGRTHSTTPGPRWKVQHRRRREGWGGLFPIPDPIPSQLVEV